MSRVNLEHLKQKAGISANKPPIPSTVASQPVDNRTPGRKAADTKLRLKHEATGQQSVVSGQQSVESPVQGNLLVSQSETGFRISLEPDGNYTLDHVPHFWWYILAEHDGKQFSGQDTLKIDLDAADVSDLATAAIALHPIDSMLRAAIENSDDDSVAHTVQTLATHYKVRSVVLELPDSSSREIRRGQSYHALLDMVSMFEAAKAKPKTA